MELFQRLGDLVEERWRARHYDENAFPALAEQALAELRPSEHVDTYDPLTWVFTAPDLPRQQVEGDPFGQPPVQIYRNRRFYIEALYWLDGTTSIHDHAFNGAFQLLTGSSIHCLYRFEERKRYSAALLVGELRRERLELLVRGDTRQIAAGRAMCHSLFHLDRPSVTIVVRTVNTPESFPQRRYSPPGLALDPRQHDDVAVRQLQALTTLYAVEHPDWPGLAARALRQADPVNLFYLADGARGLCRSRAEHESLLEEARASHGDLVDTIKEVMAERVRQQVLVFLRRKLRSPEHRFLLALLLNLRHGAEILELVRQRHPDRDPREVVVGWLAECQTLEDPEQSGKKVFDLALDGSRLAVMKLMLAGRPLGEVLELLAAEHGPQLIAAQAGALTIFREALRKMDVFAPLFL